MTMFTKEPISMHHKNVTKDNSFRSDFEAIKQKTSEIGHAIYETVVHAKDKTKEVIGTSYKDATRKASRLQETMVSYIKENPGKSLWYAGMAGVVATMLCRR